MALSALRNNSYCSACVTTDSSSDRTGVSIHNDRRITEPDRSLKILLIGDSGVGKGTILFGFRDDLFNSPYISTIRLDFIVKTIQVDGRKIKLQIWTTAGQERFFSITKSYYRNASGIIFVYDVTQANSFENMNKWLRNIDEHASNDVAKILVGNKCDMAEQCCVSRELGESLARQHNIPFYETSAKFNINIKKILFEMVRIILQKNH
ncbi:hypothetical protein I4U23_005612 [Adineta vaga]|nr:hypothetical protein I4U23_005612 [Adineta vaga]